MEQEQDPWLLLESSIQWLVIKLKITPVCSSFNIQTIKNIFIIIIIIIVVIIIFIVIIIINNNN